VALQLAGSAARTAGEAVLLQLQVVEGEGAVNAAGVRASRPLVVLVTDERGRPVEGAAVSFRLPETEPSGTFRTGLRTEIQVTGPDGRAAAWGVQWSATPGPVQIRVTAAKDQARTGALISQYVSETAQAVAGAAIAGPVKIDLGRPRRRVPRWVWIGAGGAAAVGAAVAFGGGGGAKAASPGAAAAAPTLPTFGTPVITIGRP
jgi:hypothetical protein